MFYVYFLIDPRDDQIFYVGKGRGLRMYQHEKEKPAEENVNHKKACRIWEIHAAGMRVRHEVFAAHLAETAALRIERQCILALGRGRLTNKHSGTRTHRDHAKFLLTRMKSLDVWLAEDPSRDMADYWRVLTGLTQIHNGSCDKENLPPEVSFG